MYWRRLDAGEYETEDKRFYILKKWDRLYGNHWELTDYSIDDYYKRIVTRCDTLKHAMHIAELVVLSESGKAKTMPISDDMFCNFSRGSKK